MRIFLIVLALMCFRRARSLTALLTSVVGSCAAMDRRLADITQGPAPPGNQRETRTESLRRRRVGVEWPRLRMVRAFIRVPMEQTVTRQPTAMAAIEVLR
jgi:hypothetical protein